MPNGPKMFRVVSRKNEGGASPSSRYICTVHFTQKGRTFVSVQGSCLMVQNKKKTRIMPNDPKMFRLVSRKNGGAPLYSLYAFTAHFTQKGWTMASVHPFEHREAVSWENHRHTLSKAKIYLEQIIAVTNREWHSLPSFYWASFGPLGRSPVRPIRVPYTSGRLTISY